MTSTPSAHPGAIDAVADEVSRALADVDRVAFDHFVTELGIPDRTWFCTGQGRSGLVAQMAAMRLMHLGHRSHVVGEATAPAITGADALLVVSASGATPVTLHVAEAAREVGAVVLLVTAGPQSRLRRMAHATLDVPALTSMQFGGSLFEQTALLVLDAATLALDLGDPQTRESMRRRHTNLE